MKKERKCIFFKSHHLSRELQVIWLCWHSLISGEGVVGTACKLGPGGLPPCLWRLEPRSDRVRSAFCSDNSVENRLEERSLESRTERRQLRALRKAAGGREARLRDGKEAEWQTWCLHAGGDWRRKKEEGRPLETGNMKRQLSGGNGGTVKF